MTSNVSGGDLQEVFKETTGDVPDSTESPFPLTQRERRSHEREQNHHLVDNPEQQQPQQVEPENQQQLHHRLDCLAGEVREAVDAVQDIKNATDCIMISQLLILTVLCSLVLILNLVCIIMIIFLVFFFLFLFWKR